MRFTTCRPAVVILITAALMLACAANLSRANVVYIGNSLYPLATPPGYTTIIPSQGPQAAFGGQVVGYWVRKC